MNKFDVGLKNATITKQEVKDYNTLYKLLVKEFGKANVWEQELPATLVDLRTGEPLYREVRRWWGKPKLFFPPQGIEEKYGVPVVVRSVIVGNSGQPWMDECLKRLRAEIAQGYVIGLYTVVRLKPDNIPEGMPPEIAENIRFVRYSHYKPTREV